jgi:hypothetical protein
MKKLVLAVALGSAFLCGCAHQYVMKLNNGLRISTPSKPKLKGGFYHYKDAHGQDNIIAQSRVAEIAPASQAKEEDTFTTSYPKPKTHWWQFWR